MADMLKYIAWRGDLDFDVSPLNEVDALILCQLSYLDFGGIVTEGFTDQEMTVREASVAFFSAQDCARRSDVGALINPLTVDLLRAAGESVRFGSLLVSAFCAQTDEQTEEQFAAITFTCGGRWGARWHFIAYRGTDDTLVGWKEDFNLGYKDTVPAQLSALSYLEKAGASLKGRLYTGGHSKGGNLALYAAVRAPDSIRTRICGVYNNDGPGFSETFFRTKSFAAIADKVHTYVPRLSVVGMLFSHPQQYTAVVSMQRNMIMQHDPFSWRVQALHFEECDRIGEESVFVGKTVNEWFSDMSRDERELFVETVFTVLKSTEARTNSELTANWLDSAVKMVKATSRLNAKTRDAAVKLLQMLFKIMLEELKRMGEAALSADKF